MPSPILKIAQKLAKATTIKSQVKARLADSYWKDANDFLWRVSILSKQQFDTRSFLGKIYVDLIMAVECSLKSAIISLSPDSEEPIDAYKTARKKSHKITDLLSEAKSRAKKRIKFIDGKTEALLSSLKLSVFARYDLELLYIHLNSVDFHNNDIDQTIRNEIYMKDLHNAAHAVFKFAGACRKKGKNQNKMLPMNKAFKVQDAFKKLNLKS